LLISPAALKPVQNRHGLRTWKHLGDFTLRSRDATVFNGYTQ
jgi:hypothetical protein